jgi:TetR/AcrR family transcriptional repressor of uid operon
VPKVLPEYLELRRQQILDAAAACFARRGFHQTTMQHICEEADLSPGAVYRYFPSKEAIIEAMSEYRQKQNAELLEQAISKEETLDVMDELLRLFFIEREDAELEASCALMIELVSECPRNDRIRASQKQVSAAVIAPFSDLIRGSQARGEIDASLDPDSVARIMLGLYQGFVMQKLVDPNMDAKSYGKVMRALFDGSFWRGDAEDRASPVRDSLAALRH